MTELPPNCRHVHFVGIGGIGMSALARHLLAQGLTVSGSDRAPGEQGEYLRRLGARVMTGHDAANVDGADLVVVTSAAPDSNPELVAARARGIPVLKRAELLAAIMNGRRGVAVAGTHGKTTTSALIGHILLEGGLDPTILIGGMSHNLGSNARIGGDIVVVEADEYDASFLRLQPRIGVITNVEPDHLDFYGTVERVHEAFGRFARQVTECLVVCADDPDALRIARASEATIVTYGLHAGEWQAFDIADRHGRTHFSLRRDGPVHRVDMCLAGQHNVRNALAAIAVAIQAGMSLDAVASALRTFIGVARRAEVVGDAGGVLVVDDYAHHPTEIRTVLAALLARYGRPIRLLFQPHTYTRTRSFLNDFARAFGDADAVYLLDIYAARETDTLGISGQDLAVAAAEHHPAVFYVDTREGAVDAVLGAAQPGDLVVTMGAGDVTELGPALLTRLRERETV